MAHLHFWPSSSLSYLGILPPSTAFASHLK